MAMSILYEGPALVRVVAVATLVDFCYTADGVRVSLNPFYYNVPGDQYGGDAGPPIDIQHLGDTADITLDVTKFDNTVLNSLKSFLKGGTAGGQTVPGTLMFQESKAFRVVIVPTANPMNFPQCIVNPIEWNKSVKFQRPFLSFTAHRDTNGILYDATTT